MNVLTSALDAPKDLQAVSQTDDSITLEWTNSRADVGSYRVKYSPLSGATHGEELFPRGPGDTTKATITGMGQTDKRILSTTTQLVLVITRVDFPSIPLRGRAKARDGVWDRCDCREE